MSFTKEITDTQVIEEAESIERRYQRDGMPASDWRATHNRVGACADPGELWIWIKNDDAAVQKAPLTPAMAVALGQWLVRWGDSTRARARDAWRDWDENEIREELKPWWEPTSSQGGSS